MNKITEKKLWNTMKKEAYSGFKQPPKNDKAMELPHAVQKRIKESKMTPEVYQELLYFAQEQPAGKRRLNKVDVSKLVIGEDIAPLTDTSGLRKGGQVSEGNVDRKPLKNKVLKINIENNNRNPKNPDYPYFKNKFRI